MRRHKTGRFGRRVSFEGEAVNPMDGLANLADVMLVFACGLMLALITYWNVDVSGVSGSIDVVEQGEEITEDVSGFGEKDNKDEDSDSKFEEYGTVYRDAATGKLYMVTENAD